MEEKFTTNKNKTENITKILKKTECLVYVINVLEVPSLKQTSYIRSFFYPPGKISLPSPDGSEPRVLGGIFRATPLAGLGQVHQHDFFSASVNSADLDSLTK